jgi:hypothetical protein
MSSDDWKDAGAIWHGSVPPHRNQSSEEVMSEEDTFFSAGQQPIEDDPPSSIVVDADAADPVEEEEYDAAGPQVLPELATSTDLLQRVWYYARVICFPLLFGCITALLVLPPIVAGHAYLPSLMLWPMLVLVFIVVGIQVSLTIYTNSLAHMWLLNTLGSVAVLALIGTFAVFGPWPGAVLLIAVVALCVYLVRHVFHPVPEGYVDIVFVQGKYRRTLTTGFNLLLPWEQIAEQVNTEETHWLCPPQRVQLSSEDDVILRALVSYQVSPDQAYQTVTRINNWEESLRELFVTTLQTVAQGFLPDDFMSWPQSLQAYQARRQFASDDFTGTPERRTVLNNELFARMRDRCAPWGVLINWVDLRNIELAPHGFPMLETDLANYPGTASAAGLGVEPDEPTEIFSGEVAASAIAGPPTPKAQTSQPPPPTPLKAETLANLYKAVQTGKITDPAAIRDIANSFDGVASDPEASHAVDFDAARAAQNLRDQARKYEETHHRGEFFEDRTRPNLEMPSGPVKR